MDKLKQELLSTIKSFIHEQIAPLQSEIKALNEENQRLNDLIKNLPKPADGQNGKDGRDGKDGQNGKDGKDFDQQIAKEMLELMFEPYKIKLANLKDGKDGRDGQDGKNGQDGASAYDIAVKYGFKGTELEFAQAQFGKDGRDGKDGAPGKNGADGQDGASAYDIAVKYGFKGTQLEFAKAQFGKDGKDGQNGKDGRDGKDGVGFDDLKVEFDGERTVSLKFVAEGNIKSYDFAIPAMIYKGVYKDGQEYQIGDTVTDNGSLWTCLKPTKERPISAEKGYWQLAVKHGRQGEKGAPGMSAYDLAVKNGFKGSEKEYLAEIRRGIK